MLIQELLHLAEADLTAAQKKALLADFKDWSGGFTPDECPWTGDKGEKSVRDYIEHSMSVKLPKQAAIKYLKSLCEEAMPTPTPGPMAAKVSREADEASHEAFDPKSGHENPGAHTHAAKLHAEASRQWNQLGDNDKADWHGNMSRLHKRRAGSAWSKP